MKYLDDRRRGAVAAEGDLDKREGSSTRGPPRGRAIRSGSTWRSCGATSSSAARDGAAALAAFKQALGPGQRRARALRSRARLRRCRATAPTRARSSTRRWRRRRRTPGRSRCAPAQSGRRRSTRPRRWRISARCSKVARARKASPNELSQRVRGASAGSSSSAARPSEAREAFAQAVKLDPTNVEALNGEGRLLLERGPVHARRWRASTRRCSYDPNVASRPSPTTPRRRLRSSGWRTPSSSSSLPSQQFPEEHPDPASARKGRAAPRQQRRGRGGPARGDRRRRPAAARRRAAVRGAVRAPVGARRMPRTRTRRSRTRRNAAAVGARSSARSGEVAELQGDYDAAIAHYRAALAKDPKDVAAHFHLGGGAAARAQVRRGGRGARSASRRSTRTIPACRSSAGSCSRSRATSRRRSSSSRARSRRRRTTPTCSSAWAAPTWRSVGPTTRFRCCARCSRSGRRAPRPITTSAARSCSRADALQADALRYLQQAVELDPNRAEFHVYLAWAANDATAREARAGARRGRQGPRPRQAERRGLLAEGRPRAHGGRRRRRRQGRAHAPSSSARRATRRTRRWPSATRTRTTTPRRSPSGRRPSPATAPTRGADGAGAASVLALPVRQAADANRAGRRRRSRSSCPRPSSRREDWSRARLARAARVSRRRSAPQERPDASRRGRALQALPRHRAGQLARSPRRAEGARGSRRSSLTSASALERDRAPRPSARTRRRRASRRARRARRRAARRGRSSDGGVRRRGRPGVAQRLAPRLEGALARARGNARSRGRAEGAAGRARRRRSSRRAAGETRPAARAGRRRTSKRGAHEDRERAPLLRARRWRRAAARPRPAP